MNCKKARELIITDFLDSEIHERERSRLEAHIGGCYDCTEYARAARAAAVEPFDAVIKTVPPERVWRGVLKNITAREERPAGSVQHFRDMLRRVFALPRPAFALATAFMLFLIFGTGTTMLVSRWVPQREGGAEYVERGDYLAEMTPDSLSGSTETGFGTSVEKYFL